jgi:60 kDa SS-A/Ro ribonucleoprotein
VSYLQQFSTRQTPQSEPLPGQVANSAGGHAFEVGDWARMRRFLILGSEGGTFYVREQKLTRENAQATMRCIAQDGSRAVREIVEVSRAGRAPKNDPAIFALALACAADDAATRALALDALPDVCRIGTHLFTFAGYVENFRGWGRGLRSAVARWYERDDLAYQLVKYRQRGGWTHRDLLRLSKPRPERGSDQDRLLAWAVGKGDADADPLIAAYERAQAATTPRETVAVLRDCPSLPREALNPDHLTSADVWEALLANGMPMTALIRNLATMTRTGLIAPMSAAARQVVEQISDGERLRKARVHPLAVLVALKTY